MSGAEPIAAEAAAAAIAAEAAAAATPAAATAAAAGAGTAGAGALGAESAAMLAPELGAGAGLLGTGAAEGSGAAAADAAMAAGTSEGAGLLGSSAPAGGNGAMTFTTPSIFPQAVTEGSQAGAYSDVAGEQYAMAHPATDWMGYAKNGGKAASTYSAVNGAMGGNQPPRQAPQGRPVFQGQPQPIAQQPQQPQENQFARMLYEQRMRSRGMLG